MSRDKVLSISLDTTKLGVYTITKIEEIRIVNGYTYKFIGEGISRRSVEDRPNEDKGRLLATTRAVDALVRARKMRNSRGVMQSSDWIALGVRIA